jgi:hypothetical protein
MIYTYQLMIHANEDNNILQCQLFHQYIVDMYAEIESEPLRYIRYNQVKLQAKEYIHLRYTIVGNVDGITNINDIGTSSRAQDIFFRCSKINFTYPSTHPSKVIKYFFFKYSTPLIPNV